MGLYDRDYYRTPPHRGVGDVRVVSVNTWLILINVAVFVLDGFLVPAGMHARYGRGFFPPAFPPEPPLQLWGAFSISAAIMHLQLWRVITCQFLHAGLWHLAGNMIGLWLLGPVVEARLGPGKYAIFYLLCGIAGPVMYTALWGLGILVPGGPDVLLVHSITTELIGASAGIFGVLLASAYVAPDQILDLYFFELRLKYFAWIMMAVAAYTVLVHGNNAGGQAAHLGGGLLGFYLIRRIDASHPPPRPRSIGKRNAKDWSRDLNR
jgi:membrane associated rhomboid family serine protease